MYRIRRAINMAILTMVIKPLVQRRLSKSRRDVVARARMAVSDRLGAALPADLLENPALAAIGSRVLALEAPRVENQRSRLRWLAIAVIVAAATMLTAFALSAIVRRLSKARAAQATDQLQEPVTQPQEPPARVKEPVVIPIEVPAQEGAAETRGLMADQTAVDEAVAEDEETELAEPARETSPAEA